MKQIFIDISAFFYSILFIASKNPVISVVFLISVISNNYLELILLLFYLINCESTNFNLLEVNAFDFSKRKRDDSPIAGPSSTDTPSLPSSTDTPSPAKKPKTEEDLIEIIIDQCSILADNANLEAKEHTDILNKIVSTALDYQDKGGKIGGLGLSELLNKNDYASIKSVLLENNKVQESELEGTIEAIETSPSRMYKITTTPLDKAKEKLSKENLDKEKLAKDSLPEEEQTIIIDPKGGGNGGSNLGGTFSDTGSSPVGPSNVSNSFTFDNFIVLNLSLLDILSNLLDTFLTYFV